MKILKVVLVLAALAFAYGSVEDAEATGYFRYGHFGPRITFYGGHRPFYYPYYRYPHHYLYGYKRRYKQHRKRHSPARYSKGGQCIYWSERCVKRWGEGGADYRGCMRYHGCRLDAPD